MTLKECAAALRPLLVALQVKADVPLLRLYHQVLEPLPVACLREAVVALARQDRTGRPKLPTPGELFTAAEAVRVRQQAAVLFEGCASCDGTGWEPRLVEGVTRVQRCACWRAHQARVAQTTSPARLPAVEEGQL